MADIPPRLNAYTIRRTFFKCSKYSLMLYLPPVETIYGPTSYMVNPNAILYLSLPWAPTDTSNSGKSFSIRPSNKRRLLRVIGNALAWFSTIKDLYLAGADGAIYFNTEYTNLKSVYEPKYYENPQAVKIVPIVMEYAEGKYQEGVRIYVNRVTNFMELTVSELQDLFDILDEFNFPAETQICYQALLLSFNTKAMISVTDHQNRLTPQ